MKHKTDPSIFLVRYGLGKYESTAWNLPKVCIPKTETTLVSNFDKDKFLELGYFHSNFRWQGMVFKTQNTDAGSPFMSMESLRLKLHSTKWVDKTKIIIIMTIIENKILWSVSYFSHIVIPYSSVYMKEKITFENCEKRKQFWIKFWIRDQSHKYGYIYYDMVFEPNWEDKVLGIRVVHCRLEWHAGWYM